MDGNLSVLYPDCNILPFDSVNDNLMNYPRLYPNNCGLTSSAYLNEFQNVKEDSQGFTQKHMSGRKALMCPKCNSFYSEDSNWCSSCGELLIGAELCSPVEPKFISSEVPKTQTNLMDSSNPLSNMSSSVPISFNMSCENATHSPNLVAYPRHPLLPVATDVAFSLPSCLASTFSPRNLNTQHSEWSNSSFSPSKQFGQVCHKANIPFCVPVDPSFSRYRNFGIFQNVSADQKQYQVVKNNEYNDPCNFKLLYPKENGFTQSILWNSKHFNDNKSCSQFSHPFTDVSDYRHRRTSGQGMQNKLTNDHSSLENVYHTNSVPSSYHITTNTSPINLLMNTSQGQYTFSDNLWNNSSASQIVADLLRETQISVSANTGIPPKSALYQPWQYQEMIPSASKSPSASRKGVRIRGGYCRRKHPSECSRTQLNNLTSIQNPAICRARSFSSDFEDNNNGGIHSSKLQPNPNWQSSRIAWSAHDPAVLKKKPAAYLRASYSQGNVASVQLECNTNMKPNNPNSQLDKSQQSLLLCPNSKSCSQKVKSNNTTGSSPDNRSEWNDTHAKSNRHHPPRRNRRYISKSLSVCMDGTTTNNPVASILKEEIPTNVHTNKISEPKNEFITSNWLLLPDELWLEVLRYLSPVDRVRVAQTCRHLSRLSMDRSLWRVIHLHRQHHLTDADLVRIGNLKPKELRFTYCRGDSLTATGLKRMFLVCGPGLQKLSLIGCTKGPFDQDLPLRIVADHCRNLQHVNASYTQSVRDQTVIALARSATHLISVKLNGAQQISNAAIQQLVHYHQNTLERLELFGCFRLNSSILALLGQCQELRALAFGHLHHLSSDGLLELVSKVIKIFNVVV
ncbi:unnamed protein product [Schistosoma spindalis]|nr:unnamed protein product [Schistosoma spindale]